MKKSYLLLLLLFAFGGVAKSQSGCNPPAQFSGWQHVILPNDVLQLTGPFGAVTYQWLVNGVNSGGNPIFTFQPTQSGTYQIQFIINNGSCQDTSAIWTLIVGGCGEYDENQKRFWALEDSLLMNFTLAPAISFAGRMHGNNFPMSQASYLEHSVSLSDDAGAFLFYSNGEKIWDRLHQVMPNGNGIMGHYSTYQGSLAFAAPGEPDVYYLVTLDALENMGLDGLRYSKIDMNLRGGLGDVIPTAKNILIRTTGLEVMDATYHANGKDIWLVVAEATNTVPVSYSLKTLLITETGVSAPLSSTSMAQYPGYIKFSHDGKWMTCGNLLYQFDRASGQLQLFLNLNQTLSNPIRSIEFSPDNTKVYFQEIFSNLTQFDLSSGTPLAVQGSANVILPVSTAFSAFLERLELGPDGRIYAVGLIANTLGYIDFPNVYGQGCNLVTNGIPYPHNSFFLKSVNLPTYVTGRYTNEKLKIEADNRIVCLRDTVKIYPLCTIGTYRFTYHVNGDTLSPQNGDTLYISPQQSGSMTLVGHLENACGNYYDTLTIDVKELPSFDMGPSQMLCDDSLLLDMTHFKPAYYNWFNGSTKPEVYVYQPGVYVLQLTDTVWFCSNVDSIEIRRKPILFEPDLGKDTAFCLGGSLLLTANKGEGEIKWQDGSAGESLFVSQSGWYWVEVSDSCGRKFRDSILVEVRPPLSRGIIDSLFFCPQDEVTIDAQAAGYVDYRWDDGPLGATRSFTSPGSFYIEAKDNIGCHYRDTVEVIQFADPPALNLAEIDSLCQGETLRVDATTERIAFYAWTDGPDEPARNFRQAGKFTLEAIDENGCHTSAEIEVRLFEAIRLDIPDIYFFCKDEVAILDVQAESFVSYRWHDGLTNPVREVDSAGRYTVEVEDIYHCSSIAISEVRFSTCRPLSFMPSAFSPNADGINEYFGPSWQEGITGYDLKIFNRWGQKVFDSTDPFPGWDGNYRGQSCPEGVYIYALSYFTAIQTVSHKQGTVTLIR